MKQIFIKKLPLTVIICICLFCFALIFYHVSQLKSRNTNDALGKWEAKPNPFSQNDAPLDPVHGTKRPRRIRNPSVSRPISCVGCHHLDYSILMDSPDVCSRKGKGLRLLMIVQSMVERASWRMEIRETWGAVSKTTDKISVVFLLGNPDPPASLEARLSLLTESRLHNDILQVDFDEDFQNAALKTMAGLEWATKHCTNAAFVVKGHDSTIFDPDAILKRLDNVNPSLPFLGGKLVTDDRVVRNPNNRYFVSKAEYAADVYPDYCLATGYIVSQTALQRLVNASKNVPYFHLEDVYVTGLVYAQNLGFSATDLEGAVTNANNIKDTCDFYRTLLFFPLPRRPTIREAWADWTDKKEKCRAKGNA